MTRLAQRERLARFGPGVGDHIRLGDTDLWIRVEEDRQAVGDEPIWGYAKNLRLGMTQASSAGPSELDLVIVGAIVVDPVLGILKADIGVKDGRIAGVGRAGNPEISDGIDLLIGPHTTRIAGYGLIATPGAVDTHVHTISPNLMPAALSAGVTTIYGAYPELIDATLRYADAHDVSVSLHTDGLHESAELEDTVAAIAGRTVHAYHVEGSGGGHVPDLIGLVREANVICSSTTPTIPFGRSAGDEAIPMTVVTHGGTFTIPEDMALVRERLHPATMAAEGPLHELGAIQIVNSDSQGMGRIMETVRRAFQLAHVMKAWRATADGRGHPGLPADGHGAVPGAAAGAEPGSEAGPDDNERVLRYLAKVTIEPAITHGISDLVGTLTTGHLADIVLWRPGYFGVKPAAVIKGGHQAWAPLGEGNASVRSAEPTRYAPDWAGLPHSARSVAVTFVSASADLDALRRHLDTTRTLIPVAGCRGLTRASLTRNRATAPVEVSPIDGTVTLAGRRLAVDPVDEVPLSRRYLLR
ncbi:MAG: urease subunit alpha [Chloroflexi bacterium]|nr:urease subunit alpha [Chloroflexota bacterium]